jgi:hypothetical protein
MQPPSTAHPSPQGGPQQHPSSGSGGGSSGGGGYGHDPGGSQSQGQSHTPPPPRHPPSGSTPAPQQFGPPPPPPPAPPPPQAPVPPPPPTPSQGGAPDAAEIARLRALDLPLERPLIDPIDLVAGGIGASAVRSMGAAVIQRAVYKEGLGEISILARNIVARGGTKLDAIIELSVVRNALKENVRNGGSWALSKLAGLRNVIKYGNPLGPTAYQAIEKKIVNGANLDQAIDQVFESLSRSSQTIDRILR